METLAHQHSQQSEEDVVARLCLKPEEGEYGGNLTRYDSHSAATLLLEALETPKPTVDPLEGMADYQ